MQPQSTRRSVLACPLSLRLVRAMAAAAQVQALLRFLTQDAKIPLATALPRVGELRNVKLDNAETIAKASIGDIKAIFTDEKQAKQILNAAKRVSNPKKRPNPSDASPSSSKRVKSRSDGDPKYLEMELELPTIQISEDQLTEVTIQTNRAPLVLAFAVILLKYTMPEQPLSSRLSLAQAVVSANSQSKAKSIGLVSGKTAEDEGWGHGQPKVRVMGREIAVMRRVMYRLAESSEDDGKTAINAETSENDSQAGSKAEGSSQDQNIQSSFWGLDLEALRKSNGPLVAGKNAVGHAGLPIHSPQVARNYLLKSFTMLDVPTEIMKSPAKIKPSATEISAKREQAAATLFQSLDLLFASWASILTPEELDRRAWSWYLHVRPDVAQGQSGWGQKGEVKLTDILKLRRDA
jgi:hypothetical protein